jgi:hypothetical protein
LTDNPAGRREYRLKWRALVHAAEAVGWTPADVAKHGVAGLNNARLSAGLRPWRDRTLAYYAKLIRYANLAWDHHPATDAGIAITEGDARALWTPDGWTHPAAWRTAAIARIAWLWPAPATVWLHLPASAVHRVGPTQLRITVPESVGGGVVLLPAGGVEWDRWSSVRLERGLHTPPAVCTTEPGPGDHYAGRELSLRAFQAAFARHAVACGRPGLSYERYRIAAIAAGATRIGDRGEVRERRLPSRPLDPPSAWAATGRARRTQRPPGPASL